MSNNHVNYVIKGPTKPKILLKRCEMDVVGINDLLFERVGVLHWRVTCN